MSLSWLFNNLIAAILLPPANGLLPILAGILLWRSWPRLARALVLSGATLLCVLSLGVVSRALLASLESQYPAIAPDAQAHLAADAVVVLGAGRYRSPPEFAVDDVGGAALERLRYGALLSRRSNLPLLVTGGAPDGGSRSEAEAMRDALTRDFGLTPRWVEAASANTGENALRSAELLRASGLYRVALVTHAWHMPRALAAFAAAGVPAIPAPTAYASVRPLTALDFLPREAAMRESTIALREWLGVAWYALRHRH